MIFERVSQNPFLIKECALQLRENPSAAQGVPAELALISDPDTALPLLLAAFPRRASATPAAARFSPQFIALYRDGVSAEEVIYLGKCRRGVPKAPRTLNSTTSPETSIERACNDLRRVFSAGGITEQQAQRASISALKLLVSPANSEEEDVRTILDTVIFGLSCGASQPVNESLLAGLVGWNLLDPSSLPWTRFPSLLRPFLRAILCATRNASSGTIKHLHNHILVLHPSLN